MGFCRKNLLNLCFVLSIALIYPEETLSEPTKEETSAEISPYHILYLAKSKHHDQAIKNYLKIRESQKKHLPEILEELCLVILNQGMQTKDEQGQLLSLYGASLAGIDALFPLCERALHSEHANIQLIAVQMASQLQDDRTIQLLTGSFSSPFLGIRMEAAFGLAQKKHPLASGYIESLMAKLPPFFQRYFPPLFALIGSKEATMTLKKLLRGHDTETRIQAIMTAANFHRDDLLNEIRHTSTHVNNAEQEACIAALGILGDASSKVLFEKSALSEDSFLSLASLKALLQLGFKEHLEKICQMAKNKNLFAINALSAIDGGQEALIRHLSDPQSIYRFNAAYALLKKKDRRCIPIIQEMLLSEKKDLGFAPSFSPGRSLMHWKVIPSVSIHAKSEQNQGLLSITIGFREHLLTECLELDEKDFLSIAEVLFKRKQLDLIPHLTHLLMNIESDNVLNFLKIKAEEVGAPFTRMYATLSLCQLRQDPLYQTRLLDWIQKEKQVELIQFRPSSSQIASDTQFHYALTPQESARLLIESLMFFAEKHEEASLDLLTEFLNATNANNRIVIAGLILKALQ